MSKKAVVKEEAVTEVVTPEVAEVIEAVAVAEASTDKRVEKLASGLTIHYN